MINLRNRKVGCCLQRLWRDIILSLTYAKEGRFFEIPLAKDHSFWILFRPSKEVEEDPAFYGSACLL